MTMAASAQEIRSPVESSMSISRGCGRVGDLVRHLHELVGRLSARGEDCHDALALLRGLHDPAGRVLDALGVGHRRAAELHDDRLAIAGWPRSAMAAQVRGRRAAAPDGAFSVRALARAGAQILAIGVRSRSSRWCRSASWRSAVAAVTEGGREQATVPEASSQAISERRTSFLTRIVPPAADRPEQRGRGRGPRDAAALARRMSLERKVAQLFLLGFAGQDATSPVFGQLRRLDLGGVVLAPRNYSNAIAAGGAGRRGGRSWPREERHVPRW